MCEAVDFREQRLRRRFVFECVNDHYPVVAYHEARVRASVSLGVVNGRPDVGADQFELKWKRRIWRLRQENRG